MPSANLPGGPTGRTESALAESGWEKVRDHLEKATNRIYEEIKNYPRPIAGCDAQFNFLLDERASIAAEWERMREASEASRRGGDALRSLQAFLRSSRHLDEDAKRRIAAFLEGGASGETGP
jgi:hypothetical protein